MTKLSDTQVIILSAAAQRTDGNLLPLPGPLRGGAATKVVAALLSRGLFREHIIDSPRKADPAMNTIWRNLPEPDGHGVLLFITAADADAIGVEPEAVPHAINEDANSAGEPAAGAPTDAGQAQVAPVPKRRGRPKKATPTGADVAPARETRDGTKQAQLIAMLRRKQGATIAQIAEATDWRPHTIRGFFAGALKKKLGLEVTSEKVDAGERIHKTGPGVMRMAIHRVSDRAEAALQRLARKAGQKPAQFLHDLILDFEAGDAFTLPDKRPDPTGTEEAGP